MVVWILVPDDDLVDEGIYGRLDGPVDPVELPAHLPRGAVVVARPLPGSEWDAVAQVVRQAASRVVNAPVVLWIDLIGRRKAATFGARSRRLPAAAAVNIDIRSVTNLRSVLADPWVWPEQVATWVDLRVGSLAPEVCLLVQQLAEFAPHFPTARGLTRRHGPQERQWNRAFERARLGPVGPWHSVLRMVAIGLELQRYPVMTSPELAFRFGYSSAKSLRQRFNDILGVGPPEIRARQRPLDQGQRLLLVGLTPLLRSEIHPEVACPVRIHRPHAAKPLHVLH
jgi:hypothetical protein